jgi:hypothetical protein
VAEGREAGGQVDEVIAEHPLLRDKVPMEVILVVCAMTRSAMGWRSAW